MEELGKENNNSQHINDHLNNDKPAFDDSTTESVEILKKSIVSKTEDNKKTLQKSNMNKLQLTNLKKRKPTDTKSRLTKINPETTLKPIIQNKPSIQETATLFPPFPNPSTATAAESWVPHMLAPSASLGDIVARCDAIIERLSGVRVQCDGPEREQLYAATADLYACCSRKSDEELKQLVQLRFGNSLTAMAALLSQINDCSSPAFQNIIANINGLLHKTRTIFFEKVA